MLIGASAALLAPLGPLLTPEAARAAQTASPALVDCADPASPNALLVCTDPELRQRDRLLAAAGGADDELRDALALCDSAACLRAAFDARIDALGGAGS
jgi:uncharacterized protein